MALKLKQINWIPVAVVLLVLAGLILAFFKIAYGVVVILAAFPLSLLEIARLVRLHQEQAIRR